MKAEVYSTYARRLNALVRENPDANGRLWNDVYRLAARLMREDNGHENAYPIRPEGFVPDMETKAAMVQLARASQRARWVFLSMAAREILRVHRDVHP